MVLAIQIAGIMIGVFMLYLTFLHAKRKEYTSKEYFVWMLIWIVFMLLSLFPNILDPIVATFHFSRPLDVLIIGGFLFLTVLSFYTYNIVRKNQNKVEEIVRKIALEKKE